jgi:hypothetical protein
MEGNVEELKGELALSQRLLVLGLIFRAHPPTFARITPGRFYQVLHFLVI